MPRKRKYSNIVPLYYPCARAHCVKVLCFRSRKLAGGVLCIRHREELWDSVARMVGGWYTEGVVIGFTPVGERVVKAKGEMKDGGSEVSRR